MTYFATLSCLVALLAPQGPRLATPSAAPCIVFSADTEGQLAACGTCGGQASPGIARRATRLAELAAEQPCVLLDAGNALRGRGGAPLQRVLAAHAACGYDAVHLAARDVGASAAETVALVAASPVRLVSSNLVAAASALPLAAPFVVVERDGMRLAVLGLSEPLMDASGVLQTRIGDQEVQAPELALAAWLPAARAAGAHVVLLYAGSAQGACRLAERCGHGIDAILVAGARPQHLPQGTSVPLLGAQPHGIALTQLRLGGAVAVRSIQVAMSVHEDARVLRLADPQEGAAQQPVRAASRPSEAELLPDAPKRERSHPLALAAENGCFGLRLRAARFAQRYGARKAGAGQLLLVLDSEWSNARRLDAKSADPTTECAIADLGAALRLVVDGTELALIDGAQRLPGHVALHDVRLAFGAAPRRGNLVFELPDARWRSLALRCAVPGMPALEIPMLAAAHATSEPGAAQPKEQVAKEPAAKEPAAKEGERGSARAAEPAAQQPPLRGLAGAGVSAEQLDRAIDRGSTFLWHWLEPRSIANAEYMLSSNDPDLLASLALVHSGAQRRIPAFDAHLRALLHALLLQRLGSYQAGILAMLVEAYGAPEYLPWLRACARYLVEAQGEQGSWTYSVPMPSDLLLDADRRVLQVTGGTPLDGSPKSLQDIVRTRPWQPQDDGDNSCTQFALLGLRSAARMDLKIPQETWRRALAATRARQLPMGGFGYAGSSIESPTGSMSMAGLCALAIARHEAGAGGDGEGAAMPEVRKALAWFDGVFSVETNPGSGAHPFYYLYSVERAGRILDTELLGSHEWYPQGVRHLLAIQKPDGHWEENAVGAHEIDTSFALLFLTRATATLQHELKRGGSGKLLTALQLAEPMRLYVILDASGSMLDQVDGTAKFEIARRAVAGIVAALPDGTEVALRAYGHRWRSIEPEARTDTELILPLAPLARDLFARKLAALRARGMTPLALSLQETRKDIEHLSASGRTTVLLLTDGGEDPQSRLDPRRAAEDLGRVPKCDLHVIGFDINREDWRKQLEETAQRAKGQYWPAPHGAELERHLRAAVLRQPEGFQVLDAHGKQVAAGTFGEAKTLPEGRYRFVTRFGGKEFATEFWVNTEESTSVVFDGTNARPR